MFDSNVLFAHWICNIQDGTSLSTHTGVTSHPRTAGTALCVPGAKASAGPAKPCKLSLRGHRPGSDSRCPIPFIFRCYACFGYSTLSGSCIWVLMLVSDFCEPCISHHTCSSASALSSLAAALACICSSKPCSYKPCVRLAGGCSYVAAMFWRLPPTWTRLFSTRRGP